MAGGLQVFDTPKSCQRENGRFHHVDVAGQIEPNSVVCHRRIGGCTHMFKNDAGSMHAQNPSICCVTGLSASDTGLQALEAAFKWTDSAARCCDSQPERESAVVAFVDTRPVAGN